MLTDGLMNTIRNLPPEQITLYIGKLLIMDYMKSAFAVN